SSVPSNGVASAMPRPCVPSSSLSQRLCHTTPLPRFPLPPEKGEGLQDVLTLKNIFRQKGGDSDIGQVDHVANAQIDRHTTDDIGLFAAPTALLQQLDHVDQGVAGCQGQIFALLCAVLTDGHAHRGNKAISQKKD